MTDNSKAPERAKTAHRIYIDRKMVFDPSVTWTTVKGLYPDAYISEADHTAALAEKDAEIARMRMALAETEALEEQHGAVIKRLTAERDAALAGAVAYDACHGASDLISDLRALAKFQPEQAAFVIHNAANMIGHLRAAITADPDALQAVTAAAYDAAAGIHWHGVNGLVALSDKASAAIRALTPTDALAAQSSRDAQMMAKGMREAASIVQGDADAANVDADDAQLRGFGEAAFHIRQASTAIAGPIPAILARADEIESDAQ